MKENGEKYIDLNEIKLLTNTPKTYNSYESYSKLLSQVIEDEKVRNIGIVAPYGAGKSSLIQKFINDEKKENKKIENKIITVSLANYDSIINKRDSNNGPEEKDVEKSILQQLFYKNDNKKTPSSRFATLKNMVGHNIFLAVEIVIAMMCVTFIMLYFSDDNLEIIKGFSHQLLIMIAVFLILFISMGIIIYNLIKSRQVKNIQLGNISFEKNNNENISVFNQYLDEIIYFFQNNKYNILLIEDLDRFENLEIFSKLKELNTLLNNNERITKKHRKITFIYAVKDSMFKSEEERSKFFEFILPVIPSITRDNVKDELEKNMKNLMGILPLSNNLVIDICDYITSRRVLNNIINDFIIHMSILKINVCDEDRVDKLFSLMTLKNIYPLEYEQLQRQSSNSIIYNILNEEKNKVQKETLNQINIEINSINEEIESLNSELLTSFEELKFILIGYINKEGYNFKSFKNDFSSFENLNSIDINYETTRYYNGTSSTSITIANIEEKYFKEKNYFYKREINIINKKETNKRLINEKLIGLLNYKNAVLNMSFSELYDLFPDNFSKVDFKYDLIKLLLVNDYINETHMDYLSTHDNSFTTENDKQIIKSINRKEVIDCFAKVDNSEKIILSLHKNRFRFYGIFNFYIVDKLFKMNERVDDKKKSLVECIRSYPENASLFLEKIIQSNVDYFDLIVCLVEKVDIIWQVICNISRIQDKTKSHLLVSILNDNRINLNIIKQLNINSCVTATINKMGDFSAHFKSSNYTYEDLDKLLNLRFVKLINFIPNHINQYILDNNCYEINFDNICEILSNYYLMDIMDIRTKNYDLISSKKGNSIFDYIENNIETYCQQVYNRIEVGKLSEENLKKFLTHNKLSVEMKILIAERETGTIEYSSDINISVLNVLIKKNQVIIPFDILSDLYKDIEEIYLIDYIHNNYLTLDINTDILDQNEDFLTFILEKINLKLIIDKLNKKYHKLANINNSENILLLLERDFCLYDREDFKEFIKNKNIIIKYCEKFEENIINDLKWRGLSLETSEILVLYKLLKNNKSKLFDQIFTLINREVIENLATYEQINDFFSYDYNYTVLTNDCKYALLEQNIDEVVKEKILCSINAISNDKWKEITFKSLNITKNKYEYKTNDFYLVAYQKDLISTRRNNTMYFK